MAILDYNDLKCHKSIQNAVSILDIDKNAKINLLNNITDIFIKYNNDISTLKQEIVNLIGITFSCDRCFIRIFNKNIDGFEVVDQCSEYLASKDEFSMVNYSFNDDLNKLCIDNYKKGGMFIIPDVYEFINKVNNKKIEKTLVDLFNIKSNYCFSIFNGDNLIGAIVCHYTKAKKILAYEDLKFIKRTAERLFIQIEKEIYKNKLKNIADRETALRNIIAAVRGSLDIHNIKQTIVNEVGNVFGANRCYIFEVDNQIEAFLPIDKYSEYLSSPEEISLRALNPYSDGAKYFFNLFELKKETNWRDTDKFIKENNIEKTSVIKLIQDLEVKSSINIPIYYGNNVLGMLGIAYTKQEFEYTENDLNFIRILAGQTGIALHQSRLFNETKQSEEREKLLREIITSVRSTLDISEVKNTIVTTLGRSLNADRAFIIEYDQNLKHFLKIDKTSEYQALPNEKSVTILNDLNLGYSFSANIDDAKQLRFFSNLDEFIKTEHLQNTSIEEYYKMFKVKSNIGVPIIYRDIVLGRLVLHYTKENITINSDLINLVQTIANQSAIALYQANQYEKEKKTAEREIILREISNTIRSSLNLKETQKKVVDAIGKYLDADRCIIREANLNLKIIKPIDSMSMYSKTTNDNYIHNIEEELEQEHLKCFLKYSSKESNILFLPSLTNYAKHHNLKGTFTDHYVVDNSLKSIILAFIWHKNEFLGTLSVHFTKKEKNFSENDKKFIKHLMEQVGTALYQAKLYELEKNRHKREQFLSKTTSIVKSSYNLDEIFTLIISSVQEYFDIDFIQLRTFDDIKCNLYSSSKNILLDENKKPVLKLFNKTSTAEYFKFNNSDFKLLMNRQNNNIFFKQLLCKNLYLNGQRRAVLCIYNKNNISWDIEDIHLLDKIVENFLLAIHNSSLYNQTQFISNVSHELKTPVSVIKGYSEALLADCFEEKDLKNANQTIYNYSVQMEEIINNLLSLSKLEDKNEKLDFSKVNIKSLIEDSIKLLSPIAQEKNIKIKYDKKDIEITVNSVSIQQVIMNLLKNSISYSDNDKVINIKTNLRGNLLQIHVIDQGWGIEKDSIANIFERFYRGKSNKNVNVKGSGLGLSIAKKIISLHSGSITVESEPGKGCEFTVKIPLNPIGN